MKKILFGVSSLGLGHATRTLVVIKHFLEKGYEIDIITYGNASNYLKNELKDKNVNIVEFEDYPPLERGKGLNFYFYLVIDIIKTNIIIKKEHNLIKKYEDQYEFIFSDGRYGLYGKETPSFLLTHQLNFIMPKGLGIFNKAVSYFNYLAFKNFSHILIPDYEDSKNNLAGKLSHPKWINKINHTYVGILSSLFDSKEKSPEKIDYLFTISGYLKEDKDNFVNYLISEAQKLKGKKVFVLGDTKENYKKELENDTTIYSFVAGEERKKLFLNAEIIIARAGYTTIMDLVELGKKAILYPTPNQTEQEYLADFLGKNFYVFGRENSNFLKLEEKIPNSEVFQEKDKTKESLEKIENLILKYI